MIKRHKVDLYGNTKSEFNYITEEYENTNELIGKFLANVHVKIDTNLVRNDGFFLDSKIVVIVQNYNKDMLKTTQVRFEENDYQVITTSVNRNMITFICNRL